MPHGTLLPPPRDAPPERPPPEEPLIPDERDPEGLETPLLLGRELFMEGLVLRLFVLGLIVLELLGLTVLELLGLAYLEFTLEPVFAASLIPWLFLL